MYIYSYVDGDHLFINLSRPEITTNNIYGEE